MAGLRPRVPPGCPHGSDAWQAVGADISGQYQCGERASQVEYALHGDP